MLDKLCKGLIVLLAVSLMLMNQKYILSKVTLNRNTHKTMFALIV